MFTSFHAITFDSRTLLIENYYCENRVLREIATQDHTRSFIAINYRATRGSISPYNIAELISEVSQEVATQIAKNCSRRQPHSHLRPPPRGTPLLSTYTLYFQKLESLAYIFVAACMGLPSFKFVQ